jgi:hypothetical protein
VFDRLGHSSVVITADTYAHIAPELAQRSAGLLADLLAAPPALDEREVSVSGPTTDCTVDQGMCGSDGSPWQDLNLRPAD